MIDPEMAERMNLAAGDPKPTQRHVVRSEAGIGSAPPGWLSRGLSPDLERVAISPSARPSASKSPRRLPVLSVSSKLAAQRTLTAVERFSKQHEEGGAPAQSKYYRSLLPQTKPKPGEQLAFEVDLDRCTGCKACVSACHSLNGLDESETWRSVGLIHSKAQQPSRVQTVTSSCHHCVEPGCMKGCPVGAYEKDPATGIVRHLDDQCFGCQYCTLMCPYDAPKFSPERGIVRKCDMCSQRLEDGEAPACVQACPNEAIRISIVNKSDAETLAEAGTFIAGAPRPQATKPTTLYRSSKGLPVGLAAADEGALRVEHAHWPLVIMLTLTQLGVGTLGFSQVAALGVDSDPARKLIVPIAAFAWTGIALIASIFHLGRPHLAFRAVLNVKTSWLSREALGFGLFAKTLLIYLISLIPEGLLAFPGQSTLAALSGRLGVAAAILGILGVLSSVMVYVVTRREHWSMSRTGVKFLGTMAILGAASGVVLTTNIGEKSPEQETLQALGLFVLMFLGGAKLLWERRRLLAASAARLGGDSLMAQVMLTHLRAFVYSRFGLGVLGALGLPALILCGAIPAAALPGATLLLFAAVLAGELLERAMFFKAAPGSRMPGGMP